MFEYSPYVITDLTDSEINAIERACEQAIAENDVEPGVNAEQIQTGFRRTSGGEILISVAAATWLRKRLARYADDTIAGQRAADALPTRPVPEAPRLITLTLSDEEVQAGRWVCRACVRQLLGITPQYNRPVQAGPKAGVDRLKCDLLNRTNDGSVTLPQWTVVDLQIYLNDFNPADANTEPPSEDAVTRFIEKITAVDTGITAHKANTPSVPDNQQSLLEYAKD